MWRSWLAVVGSSAGVCVWVLSEFACQYVCLMKTTSGVAWSWALSPGEEAGASGALGCDSGGRPHNQPLQPQEMGVGVEAAVGVSAAVRTDQILREQSLWSLQLNMLLVTAARSASRAAEWTKTNPETLRQIRVSGALSWGDFNSAGVLVILRRRMKVQICWGPLC